MARSARLLLSPILLIAFAARLWLALHQPANLDQLPDQKEYLALAENLQENHTLVFTDQRFAQKVYAYRLPGYPFLLALKPRGLPWVLSIRIAQILVDLSTIIAVFLIARQLSGNAVAAYLAAAAIAINPFFIYFTSLVLSETLFAALLAWGTLFLIRRMRAAGVAFLIAACLVRSTGILLLPAMVFVTELNNTKRPTYRLSAIVSRCLLRALCALLALLVCLTPWAWRNHNLLGTAIWTTTNSGITLYDGFNPHATGASDQRFVTDLPLLRSINEVDRSDYLTRQAGHWILQHVAALPALTARKILRGWSPLPLSRDFGRPVYRWISVSYAVPFDILTVVGLFSQRLTRRAKLLIVTPALAVTLAQAITVGSIRYRMPAEAPLAVLVGVGAVDAMQKVRKTKIE